MIELISIKKCDSMSYLKDQQTNLTTIDISTKVRVLKKLGVGACCQVFKIVDLTNGQEYAMKSIAYQSEENEHIRDRMLQLFRNECYFLNTLKDIPGVVKFVGSCMDEEMAFIITEVGQEDLFSWTLRYHKKENHKHELK